MALLCPDLLFGSKLEGGLRAAGHEVERFDSPEGASAATADVLVVDLNAPEFDGSAAPAPDGAPRLGFYSHVDQDTRRRAEEAGFELVVPRSRMAREMADLVERLAA